MSPPPPPCCRKHHLSMLTPDSTSEQHQNKQAGKTTFLNSWPFANFSPRTKTLQEEGQAAIKSNQKEIKGQGPMAPVKENTYLQAQRPRSSGAGRQEGITEDTGLASCARTTNAINFFLQQKKKKSLNTASSNQLQILGVLLQCFDLAARTPHLPVTCYQTNLSKDQYKIVHQGQGRQVWNQMETTEQ